jgi:hypothetical protein
VRNAAVGWTEFDEHAAVGKPGKSVLVEVLMMALDEDDRQLKLRREEGWRPVYSQNG